MGASVNKEIAGAPLSPPLRKRHYYVRTSSVCRWHVCIFGLYRAGQFTQQHQRRSDGISKALSKKKNFNEGKFVGWATKPLEVNHNAEPEKHRRAA